MNTDNNSNAPRVESAHNRKRLEESVGWGILRRLRRNRGIAVQMNTDNSNSHGDNTRLASQSAKWLMSVRAIP